RLEALRLRPRDGPVELRGPERDASEPRVRRQAPAVPLLRPRRAPRRERARPVSRYGRVRPGHRSVYRSVRPAPRAHQAGASPGPMTAELRRAVEAALGAKLTAASSLSGGDINDAYRVTLADGRAVFVKANDRADRAMFPAEARGLAWLADSRTLRIPSVL